jgi:hypothetical protein
MVGKAMFGTIVEMMKATSTLMSGVTTVEMTCVGFWSKPLTSWAPSHVAACSTCSYIMISINERQTGEMGFDRPEAVLDLRSKQNIITFSMPERPTDNNLT